MNYIVFDLEFNQAWNQERSKSSFDARCPFEIIQIGAIKLDEALQTVSTLDRLVKPELYMDIHPFVYQLTGITAEDLKTAKPFAEVYYEFIQLINDESVLCIWGLSDIKELLRNIKYHKLDSSVIPKQYINIQRYASKLLHCPKGTSVGLRNAVEFLKISIDNKFHDAFGDASYTAEVFKHIYNDDIKPVIYQPDRGRRNDRNDRYTRKTRLDLDKLIGQFEKMYDREMTEEERSIIKLAYLMGKTNQFQI
jgi:DNA polymerase III epsilon subunit-like protein